MIHLVISRLKAYGPLTAIVKPDEIFPLYRLQGSEVPAITVQLVSTDPTETKDPRIDYEVHTVEITVFSTSPKEAWTASQHARDTLDGWAADAIKQTRFLNQGTDIFEATEVFSVTQRYSIHMTR
jgi:hypothetical protein